DQLQLAPGAPHRGGSQETAAAAGNEERRVAKDAGPPADGTGIEASIESGADRSGVNAAAVFSGIGRGGARIGAARVGRRGRPASGGDQEQEDGGAHRLHGIPGPQYPVNAPAFIPARRAPGARGGRASPPRRGAG